MNSPENPDEVSIIRLIAHPEKYDGRWVRIRGFMVAEFESYGLCISQADLENHILKNCLLMGSSREIENHPEKYNRKYVTVLCKFDATLGGGMTSGGIKDLMFRVEPEVKQKGK